MEPSSPVPIEIPAPDREATLLAFYLEGVPLVQIARALQTSVETVLDVIRTDEARQCIQHYEECIERQTRLFALASRIPAMATLREVCASQGSLAERRRAASDLLRQSREAEKPAKGGRFARTPHSTPNPDQFAPNPNAPYSPEIPTHVRPLEPYEMTLDLQKQAPASQPSAPITIEAPNDNTIDPPPASVSDSAQTAATALLNNSTDAPILDSAKATSQGSFTAHEHTASWHAFDRVEPDPPAPILNPDPIAAAPAPASQDHPQPDPSIEHPLLVSLPATRIASPYDSICPPDITTPLPDAVPVAA